MKRLEKLQCELPNSSVLNRHQSISLKGGGDKRKDRPSDVISSKLSKTATLSVTVQNSWGG